MDCRRRSVFQHRSRLRAFGSPTFSFAGFGSASGPHRPANVHQSFHVSGLFRIALFFKFMMALAGCLPSRPFSLAGPVESRFIANVQPLLEYIPIPEIDRLHFSRGLCLPGWLSVMRLVWINSMILVAL